MATRGTYQVDGKLLYNHWDNYPQGAACHFLDILKTQGNLSLKSFMKCDERVNFEFTNSIFDGPAEYFYKLDKKDNGEIFVTVYNIILDERGSDKLGSSTIYEMSNFINDRFKKNFTEPNGEDKKEIEDSRVLRLESISGKISYITVKNAHGEFQRLMQEAQRNLLSGGVGNARYSYSRAKDILIALDETKGLENFEKYFSKI
jgi:hypothetical protein